MIERRATPRYALALPITIRVPHALRQDCTGITRDLSTRDVYFTTERPLSPGTVLDFSVALPTETRGIADVFVHCVGRVLRVDERRGQGFGIAVLVESYEFSRENRESRAPVPVPATRWTLSGTYFESCNCDVVCPCAFLSSPTTGECTLLIGWHIENGSLGRTELNGLNVAIAVHAPGNMTQSKWKAAMYLDSSASPDQTEALKNIFSGQAGGHPQRLTMQIGEVLGVRSVPIEYHADGKLRRLRIPDVAETEIEGISGQGGNAVTVANHPLCVAPGYPAVVAKSRRLSYSDYGFKWELTQKNGFFSPFRYGNQ